MFHEGKQIGPYTLIRRLGRGGFGEVWLGERQGKFATTQVAVKLPLDEQVDHAAIEHEAQLWAKASGHPNVLPMIEADEYDGQIVIVSEYAPDGSLEEYLKRNDKMPVEKAVETTIQILDGLEFLHSRQIIHRDLKPANILFQGNVPRLADFGISRAITDSSLSMTVAGTSEFMAVEAFGGRRNVQTDIFALGVILYLLLAGRFPFLSRKEVMKAVLVNNETLLRQYKDENPQVLANDVPAELQRIVFKSLEKSAEHRYQTAAEMREDLRRFLHGNIQSAAFDASPAESMPNIAQPTADAPDSLVTNIVVPVKAGRIETNIQSVSPTAKSKTNLLYFAVPAVALLLLAIIGWSSYLLVNNDSNRTLIPFRKGDKFGFSDVGKNILIEPKYDAAEPFVDGLAEVELNRKYGFIDKTGNVIIPIKYDSYSRPNKFTNIIDKSRKLESFIEENKNLIKVKLNKKWGIVDATGREIISARYDDVNSLDIGNYLNFNEGLAVAKLNGKYGFIDKTGKEVISFRYDNARNFIDGVAAVMKKGTTADGSDAKWGFIDPNGEEIIPLQFDNISTMFFSEFEPRFYSDNELLGVGLNTKSGFINAKGREIVPIKYDGALWFHGQKAIVARKESNETITSIIIDETGRELLSLNYPEPIIPLTGEIIAVTRNKKMGLIDWNGNEIVPIKYDQIDLPAEELLVVKTNNKYGFIKAPNEMVIPLKYDQANSFREGLAVVLLNGKYGYINKIGSEIIALKYDSAESFSDGIAEVSLNNKRFYIDKNGAEYYEP